MTTYYSVSGRSTQRPTDLPDGLTAVATVETLSKFFTSATSHTSRYGLYVEERESDTVSFIVNYEDCAGEGSGTRLSRNEVTALRDTLTTWLDDAQPRVINFGDPEPDRSTRWHDSGGDLREYRADAWRYQLSTRDWSSGLDFEDFDPESFPWTAV